MGEAERHELVVCSLEAWDDVWRRNQFLISGLLDRDPTLQVLFVEPPFDPLHELRRTRRVGRGRGSRSVTGIDRLTTYQPVKWLPRFLGPTSDKLLRASALHEVRRLGFRRPVLWVNDPTWAGLTGTGWPALYDITDDWLKARRSAREHDRLSRSEGALMRACQEVVVCSPTLAATKGQRRDVTLIRNAVDVERFRAPMPRPADLPAGKVALYLGTLHEDRLDVDLCVSVAKRLAAVGSTLALVGPIALSDANADLLMRQAGVWLPGTRPNASVPGYLQHADVLVVPHIVDDFTDTLDPIKLYEYLAVGRPVVSTPVAGFRELDSGITMADREAFVDAVTHALEADSPSEEHLGVPDWGQRVTEMGNVLDRLWTS